ncbi:MAG: hypothetical protein ACRD0X_01805, partial [Thermoanaerobaculia bacterium]
FRLLTDLASERQLRRLERIATALPAAYGSRFALEPGDLDASWVVLFSRRDEYARFAGSLAAAADRPLAGHALPGLAALPESGGPEATAQLLVHELAHLLHRAAGLPPLPPWLEEGMANDLAFSKMDSAGRLALDTVSGSAFMSEARLPVTIVDLGASKQTARIHPPEEQIWGNEMFHYAGALASLKELVATVAARRATPLPALLSMPAAEFARGEGFAERYAQSAFFVRFLLDDARPHRAAAFRAFLAWTGAGRPATPEELARTLDASLSDLEPEFHAWLAMQAEGL